MANAINELRNAIGAGARPSKYRIALTFPTAVSAISNKRNIATIAKATTFPSITVGMIEAFNQGRKLVLPGDTSFTNTWTVTFYNTENHDLRRDFVAWLASCDHFQDNMHSGDPAQLMIDAVVTQLDSAGKDCAMYTFHNLFPQEIAEISIGADQLDALEEFDVTFAFSDWVVGSNALQEPAQGGESTKNVTALGS